MLCSLGWPWAVFVAQAGLELSGIVAQLQQPWKQALNQTPGPLFPYLFIHLFLWTNPFPLFTCTSLFVLLGLPHGLCTEWHSSPFCICAVVRAEMNYCLCISCGLCDLCPCGDQGWAPGGQRGKGRGAKGLTLSLRASPCRGPGAAFRRNSQTAAGPEPSVFRSSFILGHL